MKWDKTRGLVVSVCISIAGMLGMVFFFDNEFARYVCIIITLSGFTTLAVLLFKDYVGQDNDDWIPPPGIWH